MPEAIPFIIKAANQMKISISVQQQKRFLRKQINVLKTVNDLECHLQVEQSS